MLDDLFEVQLESLQVMPAFAADRSVSYPAFQFDETGRARGVVSNTIDWTVVHSAMGLLDAVGVDDMDPAQPLNELRAWWASPLPLSGMDASPAQLLTDARGVFAAPVERALWRLFRAGLPA